MITPLYYSLPQANGHVEVYDKLGNWVATCVSVEAGEALCKSVNRFVGSDLEEKLDRLRARLNEYEDELREIRSGRGAR